MGGGDNCVPPPTIEEDKTIEIEAENVVIPTSAIEAENSGAPTPASNAPQVDEENKDPKIGTLHGYMPKIDEEEELCKVFKGYSLEDCKKSVAEFVVLDEMPFKVVEGIGFRKMLNRFKPRFTVPSRVTVSRDCFQLYLDEKKKLKEWLAKSCARVCLTTDCWTSNQNYSYMSLTAHFIDEEWKLQKRIINFCQIENHKGDTVGRKIEKCLREWGIEKVFTITVDNATSNDGAITYLQRKLGARGGLVCGGKYMHVRCCAHVLNLIVNEGIKEQQTSIKSIRNVVRWNSTYLMLEHAEKFEKAFDRLFDQEPDFLRWFGEDNGGKKENYLCWCLEDVYDKEVSTSMTGFVKLTLEILYKFYEKEVVDDKGREDGGSSFRDVLDDNTKVLTGAKGISKNRVNMWKKQKKEKANADSKSDVERYLAEDTVEDENFDILAWWKVNASKYRVLSLIAHDVLGIPLFVTING
ncbi:zinc finger BED domain-containing protein RICESLEEPER 1-like [Arachis stenosperma]|uniref:zinc finger BED domain-containing protein RICESLEEPER 1-like n=1 Tax=Arachis stenosperma TaxID=217475 RepID=UPI0025AC1E05|nr:zinc finger BED domain-containing protein RICESLEEPER 1-like [Arachis stenosperma]